MAFLSYGIIILTEIIFVTSLSARSSIYLPQPSSHMDSGVVVGNDIQYLSVMPCVMTADQHA